MAEAEVIPMNRVLFVDIDPKGKPLTPNQETGAWLAIEDTQGTLVIAASTAIGHRVNQVLQAKPDLMSTLPATVYGLAANLSDMPKERGNVYRRIEALLAA